MLDVCVQRMVRRLNAMVEDKIKSSYYIRFLSFCKWIFYFKITASFYIIVKAANKGITKLEKNCKTKEKKTSWKKSILVWRCDVTLSSWRRTSGKKKEIQMQEGSLQSLSENEMKKDRWGLTLALGSWTTYGWATGIRPVQWGGGGSREVQSTSSEESN